MSGGIVKKEIPEAKITHANSKTKRISNKIKQVLKN